MRAVEDIFSRFMFTYNCEGRSESEVGMDLIRMLRIRHRNNAPRRPPKVILIGPPGCGKST